MPKNLDQILVYTILLILVTISYSIAFAQGDVHRLAQGVLFTILFFIVLFFAIVIIDRKPRNILRSIGVNQTASRFANKGDFSQALKHYNQAILLAPRLAVIFYNRGICYLQLNNFEEALQDFEHALQLDSKFIPAYLSKAYIEIQKNNLDQAITECNVAIGLTKRKQGLFAVYFMRGSAYLEANRPDEAIADTNKCIEINPKKAEPYIHLALSYLKKGDDSKVLKMYDEALQRDPKLALTYNNRGFYYINKGNFEAAERDLQQAVQLQHIPESFYVYGSRGTLRLLQGRYNEALADFQKSLDIKPNYDYAIMMLAATHATMGQIADAQHLWQELIERDAQFDDLEWIQTKWNLSEPLLRAIEKVSQSDT